MTTRLRFLREAKSLTRAALAARAGINASTEGAIESGRLRPYPVQLRKLARALRLPVVEAESLLDVVSTETILIAPATDGSTGRVRR